MCVGSWAAMTVRASWPKTPMQTHSQLIAHVSLVISSLLAKCPVIISISISGLVVEYIVAIDVTRARFPADAYSMLHMWALQHQMAYDRDTHSTEIWRSTKARPLMWTHMCTHMRAHCPAHACQHKHTQTQTHTHTHRHTHTHTNTHQTPRHYSMCFCFFVFCFLFIRSKADSVKFPKS